MLNIRETMSAEERIWRLQGDMTIYTVQSLQEAVKKLEAEPQQMTVDLAEVTAIDTTGIQMLIRLKRHLSSRGGTLRLVKHSDSVAQVFDLLGLVGYFGDPMVIHSAEGRT